MPCSLMSRPFCSSSGETRRIPTAFIAANSASIVTNDQPQMIRVPLSWIMKLVAASKSAGLVPNSFSATAAEV